jgi:hypothetical protein
MSLDRGPRGLGNPRPFQVNGADGTPGRPRRARRDGGGTGSAGRGAMAGRQARRARGEARDAGGGPSRTRRLTVGRQHFSGRRRRHRGPPPRPYQRTHGSMPSESSGRVAAGLNQSPHPARGPLVAAVADLSARVPTGRPWRDLARDCGVPGGARGERRRGPASCRLGGTASVPRASGFASLAASQATGGTNRPTTLSFSLPFSSARQTKGRVVRTVVAMAAAGLAFSIPNGAPPSTTMPPISAATITASTDLRPSWTSRHPRAEPEGEIVERQPGADSEQRRETSRTGLCGWIANSRKPTRSTTTIPQTRWWMWRPPATFTLPGHQGTLGLRIRRALVRMKAKEPRNPARTRSPRAGRRPQGPWRSPSPRVHERLHRLAVVSAPLGRPGWEGASAG